MSIFKKILIFLYIIFLLLCVAINGWYLYLGSYAPTKVVSQTFEVGLQEISSGEQKYFMEVNSYADCFEVKFNYMLDETQTKYYSQGLQYYSPYEKLGFADYTMVHETGTDKSGFLWLVTEHYIDSSNCKKALTTYTERYNYASATDYSSPQISSNPINEDTKFKIQFGEGEDKKLFLMEMKGSVYLGGDTDEPSYKDGLHHYYYSYYDLLDIDYLCGLLFESISTLPNGTNSSFIFEFGNLFNYYIETEVAGVYELVNPIESSLIIEDLKSYYSIKVTKNAGNIQKYNQSLFNCVAGNSNFNLTDKEYVDYFYGKTTINVTNAMFNPVAVVGNKIVLKLKEEFLASYLPYKDIITLNVSINKDYYSSLGYEFIGFANDSGLDNFDCIIEDTLPDIDNGSSGGNGGNGNNGGATYV